MINLYLYILTIISYKVMTLFDILPTELNQYILNFYNPYKENHNKKLDKVLSQMCFKEILKTPWKKQLIKKQEIRVSLEHKILEYCTEELTTEVGIPIEDISRFIKTLNRYKIIIRKSDYLKKCTSLQQLIKYEKINLITDSVNNIEDVFNEWLETDFELNQELVNYLTFAQPPPAYKNYIMAQEFINEYYLNPYNIVQMARIY